MVIFMVRHKLTDAKIKALKTPGIYADGAGLYLRVHGGGSKSWFFIFTRHGRRRELGLGGTAGTAPISLARAREKADEIRQTLAADGDPFADRVARKAAKRKTFRDVAEEFIEAKGGWTPNTDREWRRQLLEDCAKLGKLSVDAINTELVEEVLKPIWATKPATGQRVRGKIEAVLDYAIAKRMRYGDNPARWKGHLEHILAAASRNTGAGHAAMAYRDVPAFLKELGAATTDRCLKLVILTAVRSGEARLADWSEFNLKEKLWTIPGERTKTGREHVVPLTDASIKVLGKKGTGLVFEGSRKGGPLGNSAMNLLMNEKRPGITVHGFRSTFRDWCGDKTDFPREVAEAALGHAVGNVVEQAYRRGSALEKRRELMTAWARFCVAKKTA